MNCLSINIQGAGFFEKRVWIKSLCIKYKTNFLAIQETKKELIDLSLLRSSWGNLAFSHAFSPSHGASGGILVVWDPNIFIYNKVTISDWYVAVEGVWAVFSMDVLLISVYAPQKDDCKIQLWDEISLLIASFSGECVLMGDFNEVRTESERFGSQFQHVPARFFNQFIDQADLVDIPMGGPGIRGATNRDPSFLNWIVFWSLKVFCSAFLILWDWFWRKIYLTTGLLSY